LDPYRRKVSAFTLVELLVVIGIIALLVSILLPSLGAARRSARSVKCLSSLRQLGNAFAMYSQEHRGYWPVAVHGNTVKFPVALRNGLADEIRWPDLIAPYITSKKDMAYDEVYKVRQNSVLWGCPEYSAATEQSDAAFASKVRPGYGMNYYLTDTGPNKYAYINTALSDDPTQAGRYYKQTEWTKPTERALIADTLTHVLSNPSTIASTNTWYPVLPGEAATPYFLVDGNRHGPAGNSRRKQYEAPYMNMLFCDLHASVVSVRDTYNAIHSPGQNTAGN
ncbi:MAG: N-terminal cleavage protein, partial [Phycisphaerales bacterium]|nr:N-terminal cleavage protein [Phycisphaerales bacterium]